MAEQVDALSAAGVSELANFVIRPPRASYSRSELGDRTFVCERVPCRRDDLTLVNQRGLTVYASHFRPTSSEPDIPTIVYLHGNGSCRVEASMLLHYVLPYGLAFFAFDFSGSGMSDGEYISLGVNEKHDVETVVDHLVYDCGVSRIVLWGHSMGAATAVMYAGLCDRREQVKALVLDSPFASFDKLAQSMVADMPIPLGVPRKLILTVGVRAVRKVVRERAGFDVIDIDPLSAARKISPELPALFLHGTADAVVPLHHGELLFKNFPGHQKEFVPLAGYEHDSARPESAMDKVHIFLQAHLCEHGVRDISFLDQLKSRGNVAMLSGRFADAVLVYTEALDALSELITSLRFAIALGERRYDVGDRDDYDESLARRNSSISNFVSTVKRWRHARSATPGEENYHSRRSIPSSRTPTGRPDRSRQASSIDQSWRPNGVVRQAESATGDGESGFREGKFSSSQHGLSRPPGGPEMRIRPETDMDRWPGDPTKSDRAGSDSSNWSGKFGRRSSRSWRGRAVVESLKKRMPFSRSRPSTTETFSAGHATEHVAASRAQSMDERQHSDMPNEGEVKGAPGVADKIDNMLDEPGTSHDSQSRRSGSGGRLSRSSSRVHIRHRGKRRENGRRSRPAKFPEARQQQGRTLHTSEDPRQRLLAAEYAAKRSRFSVGDGFPRQRDLFLRRSQTEDNILSNHGISSWNLTPEQKTLALALLGNRSLARRKSKDLQGALFDAVTSLQLDPTWIRGYVRKAAALREQGKLHQARSCVMEGLGQEPEHDGLQDMLHSVDIEIEADELARDRLRTQAMEPSEAATDAVSSHT